MLALGAGVSAGEIERPIAHVDIGVTAADMLGVKIPEVTGQPVRELLT
jgi:hypothetical protein